MRNQSGTGYDLAGPGASETRFDTIKSVTSHSLEQPSERGRKPLPCPEATWDQAPLYTRSFPKGDGNAPDPLVGVLVAASCTPGHSRKGTETMHGSFSPASHHQSLHTRSFPKGDGNCVCDKRDEDGHPSCTPGHSRKGTETLDSLGYRLALFLVAHQVIPERGRKQFLGYCGRQ